MQCIVDYLRQGAFLIALFEESYESPYFFDAYQFGVVLVIVRIMNQGFYQLAASHADELLMLELLLDSALNADRQADFAYALDTLIEFVRRAGEAVSDEVDIFADLVVPAPDSTIAAWKLLLDSEAFED